MYCPLKADFELLFSVLHLILVHGSAIKGQFIHQKGWRLRRGETSNWIWTYKSYLIDIKITPSSSLKVNSFIMYTTEHFNKFTEYYYIKNHEITKKWKIKGSYPTLPLICHSWLTRSDINTLRLKKLPDKLLRVLMSQCGKWSTQLVTK